MKTYTPLVSICTTAFNHEDSIRQTLEGFLLQKVTFPYEIVINDDASSDSTAQIIREYEQKHPNLINATYQNENQYSKGVWPMAQLVLPRAKGKYIAYCEGDDYWTDPYKLQKQVDFLEANPEYGMVCTNYSIIENEQIKDSVLTSQFKITEALDIDIETYLKQRYLVRTLTVMFRSEYAATFLTDIDESLRTGYSLGDNILWAYIINKSKGRYLPNITAFYRVLANSASHQKSVEKERTHKRDVLLVSLRLAEEFNLSKQLVKDFKLKLDILEMKFDVIDRKRMHVFLRFWKLALLSLRVNKTSLKLLRMAYSRNYFIQEKSRTFDSFTNV